MLCGADRQMVCASFPLSRCWEDLSGLERRGGAACLVHPCAPRADVTL